MRPTLDVLKAIEAAIQIKEDGLVYYTQAARQIGDPRGKRILQSLAKDKATHLKMFEDAREALLNREAWPPPGQASAISPREFNIPPIFPTVEIPDSQLAVLRRGIQAEEDSIAF